MESELEKDLENLLEARETVRSDAWALHIPLPRIVEILGQTISCGESENHDSQMSLKNPKIHDTFKSLKNPKPVDSHMRLQIRNTVDSHMIENPRTVDSSKSLKNSNAVDSLVGVDAEMEELFAALVSAASCSATAVSPLLHRLPRESRVWDHLSEKLEETENLPKMAVQMLYLNRFEVFEKHVLIVLKNITNVFQNDQTCVPEWSCIGHSCTPLNINEFPMNYLGDTKNISLIRSCFQILQSYLNYSNYSVISIKTIQCFTKFVFSNGGLNQLFSSDLANLCSLLLCPPCVSCNHFIQSKSEIEQQRIEIEQDLDKIKADPVLLRTILCMSEWLSLIKDSFVVKALMLLT